eukprot:849072-Alexandrium_andersonii.AAC.1
MVRRLCAHVVNHARGRGTLSALHALFTGEHGGGAEALRYAPHRFLSHAGPVAAICDAYVEIL